MKSASTLYSWTENLHTNSSTLHMLAHQSLTLMLNIGQMRTQRSLEDKMSDINVVYTSAATVKAHMHYSC